MKTITASFDDLGMANVAKRAHNRAGFDEVSVRSQREDEAAGDTVRSDERGNKAKAKVNANGATHVDMSPDLPFPSDRVSKEESALLTLRTEDRVEEALDIIDQNYGAVETMSKDVRA